MIKMNKVTDTEYGAAMTHLKGLHTMLGNMMIARDGLDEDTSDMFYLIADIINDSVKVIEAYKGEV